MNVPFFACIGTDIENLIYTDNAVSAARFFIQAIDDLDKQNKIILFIPQGLLDCAGNDAYIKAVREKLSVLTQAKITIGRNSGLSCALNSNLPVGFLTTDFMRWQIQNRELPFTIGVNNTSIEKTSCEHCFSDKPCSAAMSFCAKHLESDFIDDLKSKNSIFIKEIVEKALATFYQEFTLDAVTKRLLARLFFIREELDCSRLSLYDKVYMSKAFFEDSNKASVEDKCNIVLSAARVFCFPPVKNTAKREKGSLDWHKDKQPLGKEVDFFRADVLPGLLTGRQHSGAKRLFFGHRRSDNRILLFGYTPEHDFDDKKLIQRWRDAEREL